MQVTTLEITEIPLEVFKALSEMAQQKGKSPADFVRELIEAEVLAVQSFDEVLAPIRQGFKESGMTAAEAETFLEDQLRQHRAEKRAQVQGASIKTHPAASAIA